MKSYNYLKNITMFVLIISILSGPFSLMVVGVGENIYTLQHSLVLNENGNWVTNYGIYNERNEKYNCYAYAIGRIESNKFYNLNEQWKAYYYPGDIYAISPNYVSWSNIDQLRCSIIKDLTAMGHTDFSVFCYKRV